MIKKNSPLQSGITVKYALHKYFINFNTKHPTAADSTTKPCIDFSSCYTIDIKMK